MINWGNWGSVPVVVRMCGSSDEKVREMNFVNLFNLVFTLVVEVRLGLDDVRVR